MAMSFHSTVRRLSIPMVTVSGTTPTLFPTIRACRNELETKFDLFEVIYSRAGTSRFDDALEERSMCPGCSQVAIDTQRVLHAVIGESLRIIVDIAESQKVENLGLRQSGALAKRVEEFYNDDCIIGLVVYCAKVVRAAESLAD